MSTLTINIQEAQNQLQYLLSLALGGAEVIFTQDERPVVRMVPVLAPESQTEAPRKKRIAGLNRGEIWVSEDFDDPLPDEFWFGEDETKP